MTAGRLLGLPYPALDQDGLPIPGSTLTFYQNGTVTLQSVYTDSTLTTPLANPLASDGSGRFPEIWADTSNEFSVLWEDETGAVQFWFNEIFPTITTAADTLLSNLANNATARTNLGLGSVAVEDVGTSGHKIPFMDQVAAVTGAWS